MNTLILIKKNGDVLEKKKKINIEDVYKYCGYKVKKNFDKLHTFILNNRSYHIYGKTDGRANFENKYELPPPIDKKLFFGTLCIIKTDNDDNILSLDKNEWEKTYEALFGGFEDIGSEDNDIRSSDTEIYSDKEYTKEGYLKDDFIVEDGELVEEEYESYED
jgi:hypothetical protein